MTKTRLFLILGLSIVLVLISTSVVFAGSSSSLLVSPNPHTTYSATTDFCLQCHDIHEAQGDYALMWQSTVVDTCGTCHGVYLNAPTGARNPGYPGQESGTAALKSVYKVNIANKYTHEGHRLGQAGNGPGPYTYADGTTTSTADYIPGSGGKLLTQIPSWSYWQTGAAIDPADYPASGRTALNGLYCASCHSPHGTQFGNTIVFGSSTTSMTPQPGFKLLTRRPNHTTDTVDSSSWTSFTVDGWQWCSKCHTNRLQGPTDTNGSPIGNDPPHNHPSSFCLQCHGNNSDPSILPDFPHTGATNLLVDYPDKLCIGCHVAGLP